MTHSERIEILKQPFTLEENINELYSKDWDITLQQLAQLTGFSIHQLKKILGVL
jgi:hypothetical protein